MTFPKTDTPSDDASKSESNSEQSKLPGKLGDPLCEFSTDSRAGPRLVAALAPFDMEGPVELPVSPTSAYQDRLDWLADTEGMFEGLFQILAADIKPVVGVEQRIEVIKGTDNNDINLHIHRPVHGSLHDSNSQSDTLPCVYHMHGGGMAMLQASDPVYGHFRDSLAALGMVVIGVEFRNSGGKLGNHPFPAGLNDCLSGLQWTFANKAKLGISHIVLSGESGGGNLALATCLKAKSIGELHSVDGVYALCPMIFNANNDKSAEFPSQIENDGYFINYPTIQLCASLYDPDNTEAENPLCWPMVANKDDLAGLPPHMISVNEMDLFRDEGLKYYRNLLTAGVRASSRTVNGTCHSADVILPNAAPDIFAATLWDIYGFTVSLSTTKKLKS